MRRILLILVTLLLLGGGFYLYLSVQKPPPQEARPRGFAETTMPSLAPPSTGPAVVGVGSGTDVAVKVFDRKTGALSYQFIAERYDPQADGSVNVTRPHARFYLGNGKVVALRGVDGRITMENAAANAQAIASGAAGGTPNRGNLRDVTIQLFDDDDDAEPSLTAVVPNASFDNDTLRIATEAQEIDGQRVAADQIPVRVRGRDVEFDGRGLLIRWEEGGQRLSLLEIAHGERLTLLRPGKLSTSGGLLGRATPSFPIGEALASADPAPATDQAVADRRKRRRPATAAAPAPTTKPKDEPQAYRATFYDDVRIFEGDDPVGTAQQLAVDFLSGGDANPAGGNAAPTIAPAGAKPANPPGPSPVGKHPRRPSTQPASAVAPPPTPEDHAAPATRPADPADEEDPPEAEQQPITVRWTGKMVVRPQGDKTLAPTSPSDYNVSLVGAPFVLSRQGGEVIGATLHYSTDRQFARIEPSPQMPRVKLRDAQGAVMDVERMEIDRLNGIARMNGAGSAELPVDAGPKPQAADAPAKPSGPVKATWAKSCTVTLAEAGQDVTITSARLVGDVNVTHPQLKLDAGQVNLGFAPPAAPKQPANDNPDPAKKSRPQPLLKGVEAIGQVRGLITGADGKSGSIECDRLGLAFDTTGGEPVLSAMSARGSVRTFDDRQGLSSDELHAKFVRAAADLKRPAAQQRAAVPGFGGGDIDLATMQAIGNVHWTRSDGSATADGAMLDATGPQATLRAKLIGWPDKPAKLVNGPSFLTGPAIEFEPNADKARVLGAGELFSVRPADPAKPDAKPQQLAMKWSQGINVDGDLATIDGDVVATSPGEAGATQTARAQQVVLHLEPATRPTTKPAAGPVAQTPTTKPAKNAGLFDDQQPLGGKQVRRVDLKGKVDVASVLSSESGDLLRRMHLLSPDTVSYDPLARRLDVPGPGQMLFEDRRPATTRPSGGAAGVDPGNLSDLRGTTAVKWEKSLVYDEGQHQATLVGGVAIVHEGDTTVQGTPAEKPIRLDGDRVTAEFDPAAGAAPNPTNTAAVPGQSNLKLKRVRAEGSVTVVAPRAQFVAGKLEFDPSTDRMTATGADGRGVELFDESGVSRGTFDELIYNTRTRQIDRLSKPSGRLRR